VPYDFDIPVTGLITLTATWTAVAEDTVPDSGSPGSELAATGANVTPALGVATLLLAGGITLIALRRRATTRST
jgi:LPXTG-motif cell wall-anchored protein